jgi:hypothetical protein
VLLPRDKEIKQLRSNDAGQNSHQTHVPHRIDVDALSLGQVNRYQQTDD